MRNFTLFRSDMRTNKTKRWLGLLTFCMMLFGYQSFAQVQVGYSTTTTTYNVPFQNLWGYSWTQSIYTAQELSADAGNITAIQYYYSGASALNTMGNFTMYIGHTTKNSFDSTAITEWVDVADLEQVFTGGVTASEAGWITITLDAPFAYDGISNLVIAIDENQASYTSSQTFRYSETAPNRTMQYRSDSTNPDPAAPPIASTHFGYVANTVFVGLTSNLVIPPCLDALPTFAETSTGCGNLGGTLTWAAPTTGYTNAYKVYIGTTSGSYDVVDGNIVTTLSYNLSTTLADTTYYYKVVPTNPAGDAENCVEGTFTTPSGICYCIPTGGANNSDEILNFTLNNLNNTSATSEGTAGYSDYTTTVAPAIIPAGIPTIASLTSGTGSGNHGAAIWIDYNQNGTFEESEKVTFIGNTIVANTTVSFPAFTVPVSVTPGNYRLRIQYRYLTSGELLDPCITTSTFTETEDYLVNITEAPSCIPPADVTASNATGNSVDIAWVSTGTIFDIKWGLPGFDEETEGTLLPNFTSGGTLSGLTPITTYQFYIRQDCGDGDISMWAGPYSFTTTCAILVPPTATEDFTGYTGTAPATLPCWSEATGTLDNPLTGTTSSWMNQTYNTNINSAHPFGTAAYINLYGTDNEWLISPAVDLGDGTTPYQLEYDVSITPWTGVGPLTDMEEKFVKVVISTDGGETWSSTNVLHTYDNNDIPAGGREDVISLTGYSGVVKFAFYAHSTSFTPDTRFYIDNWKVIPVPTCPKPTFFEVSNVTYNSADLSWVSTGTTFDVIWGEVGFDVTTEGTLVSNFVSGQTLNGLNPVTTYQVYVRQNCGDGDMSPWTSPLTFTTLCGVLTPPTATEDFTGFTGVAPATLACWSEATGTLDNPLTGTTSLWANQVYNNNIDSSHPFGTAAYINLYSSNRNEWLISPTIDLGDGMTPYQLEYNVSVTPWSGTADVTALGDSFVKVVVSTDGGETWSSTDVLHTYDNNDIPTGGREDALPLTGYSGEVKFAFYAHSEVLTGTPDIKFYIDNWKVVPVPTCPKPTFLGVSDITYTSAELTWTSTGTLFDIEYGEAGFTPTGTPSAGLTGVAHPYTLTGLTAETSYQYYVRQDCGDGDISTWAGPYTFYTGYCLATSTGTSYRITGFATTDGYTNIDNLNNGTTSGYNNYSHMTVTQSEGGTFNYTITVPANTVVDIWIDIDHNLIFDPIDELLASHDAYQSSATTYNGSFTIPMGMPPGDYRLRVRSRYYNNAANPCGTAVSGETEDYTLSIIETPSCLPVTGLGAENISYDSADLFWTIAEGTSFDIEYGEAGFIPTETPSTGLVGISNPYTLTGLTPLTSYEYYVRQNCGVFGESIWVGPFSFSTECLPPAMPVATGGSVCGLGEVTLAATADADTTIAWYDSETDGTKLGEGETFVTPVISETTSYWAAAYTGGGTEYVGPVDSSIGTGGYSTSLTYVTFFTVTNATTIESVDIFVNTTATIGTTGSIVINDLTNGGVVGTYTYSVEQTGLTNAQTVMINQPLPPGDYSMGMANTTVSLYRNTAGATFPYVGTDISLTGQGFSGFPEYYYYFYNWAIASGCSSDRTEVIATVTAPPALELSTDEITICEGEAPDTVTITTGAADYDTFVWEPSTGVTGDATTGWTFSPAETTTYTLTASQTGGAECATTTTVEIIVNPLPTAITVVGDEEACVDSIAALSVEGNIVSGTAVFGTGTTAPGTTTWPNPLSAFYGGTKHQMLYTASELSDQGLVAGSEITAVTFDMATVNTTNGTLVDFTIRMGTTTVTEMTELLTGTSDVYGPSTFTPSTIGVGLVSFTLTTPYVWDGESNLIVETVHNSGNSGNGSGTTTRTSPTPNNSVYRVAKDNVAGGVPGFDSTTFTVVGAHNIRPNMTFVHSMEQTMITWAPATNLYTDAAATVPYVSGDFTQVVYFKPTEQGSVTYTATSGTEFGCTVSDDITIAVGAAITAPTGDATQTLEDGDTLADLVVNGTDLVWYADADLTQEIADTTVAVDGATYYVVTESGACQSAALAITVIIDPCTLLAAPTGDAAQSLTLGDTLAELDVTGVDLVWYSDEDLTVEIDDTTVAVDNTTYYVVSTTVDCQSDALAITVTVIDPCAGVVTPTGATEQSLLLGQTLEGLTVAGDNLTWYSDEDLTVEIPETTAAVNGTTYYVVSETDDCQSDALAITVTVIDPCAEITTPTGDAIQTLEEGDTLEELVVNGDNLAWYADADLTQSLPATTIAQNGVTYYVASVTDICQSEPLAITVTIAGMDPCEDVTVPAPTGEEIQTLTEGQTLADLIVEGENLQWYADADLTESLEETHVAEETTYYVTQTIGVCTGEALAVTVQFTVGREDFESFAFRFYPNPVGEVLNLTSNVEITQIDLFNMLGQKVNVFTNANNTQVDMSGLPTGNYIISVTIEGITKTFKVVKN